MQEVVKGALEHWTVYRLEHSLYGSYGSNFYIIHFRITLCTEYLPAKSRGIGIMQMKVSVGCGGVWGVGECGVWRSVGCGGAWESGECGVWGSVEECGIVGSVVCECAKVWRSID